MKQRLTAVLSAAAILAGLIVPVQAADKKNGCSLAPLSYDETGVLPSSIYTLSGNCGENPVITINDDIPTAVTRLSNGSYKVSPEAPLDYNTLYTFTLDGDEPVSWAFQTADKFCIKNSLPGDNGSNVPVNTGIELVFSHEDFDLNDVTKSFSISPSVKGKWEKHKSTAVFIPDNPLVHDTKYTVTVSGKMAYNNDALGDDYSFSFITAKLPDTSSGRSSDNNSSIRISSFTVYDDVSTGETADIDITLFVNTDYKRNLNAQTDIYSVSNNQALLYFEKEANTEDIGSSLSNPMYSFTTPIRLESDSYYNELTLSLPDKLAQGFYMVKTTIDTCTVYTLIQSTDIAAYIASDNDQFCVWVNDYKTGSPLSDADISTDSGSKVTVSENGIAFIKKTDISYIKIESGNNHAYYPINQYTYNSNNEYISTVITDRNLYRETDTVYFWGTARDFDTKEPITTLNAELYDSSYWWYRQEAPVAKTDIRINENTFEGTLNLPNLSAGTYVLRINNGSKQITETYITVEDYVKPTYKMSISADKQAIFYGDSISYTINTAFFEGTPLPNLAVNWRSYGYTLQSESGSCITESDGKSEITVTPTFSYSDADVRGEVSCNISAYASLPESGDISAAADTRVFVNNVTSNIGSSFADGTTDIKIHMDTVTLDRLNDGTAEYWSDYIDKPDAGRSLTAEIYYNCYVKEQTGTAYNYITKTNEPVYRYTKQEQLRNSITLKTDKDGNCDYSFIPTDTDKGWYTLDISCIDDFGRTYRTTSYIKTKEYSYKWDNIYSSDSYRVETDKEKYDIGDEACVAIFKGTEYAKGNILCIKDCNGIKEAAVTDSGEYRTSFNELPRAYISCILFEPNNGYRILSYGGAVLEYDYENSRLNISLTTDKDEYAPGSECTVTANVSDKDGNPVEADMSIGVVDEALYALSDNASDVLSDLYSYTRRTAATVFASHTKSYGFYGIHYKYAETLEGGSSGSAIPESVMSSGALQASAADNGDRAADKSARLRSEFKDTAVFLTAHTNGAGQASVSFRLPDNITSWRATTSVITADLKAGTATCPVKVTMPSFISYNMSKTYITGDSPIIGVNLYGGSLDGSEAVSFVIDDGENTYTGEGRSFERVNIPISTMNTPGKKSVTVTAYIDDTPVDALNSEFEVVDTYNTAEVATYYRTPFDKIKTGSGHNVDIIFTDKNRGALLSDVFRMRYMCGSRLDQRVALAEGINLLNNYYDKDISLPEVNMKEYQHEDGGMKLFTYGNSDLDATAKLTKYLKDDVDKHRLTEYLYNNKNDIKALYALACLHEPVLNDLNRYAIADNLNPSDYLYIALAFCELGETDMAAELFTKRIEPLIENTSPDKRIKAGSDNDDILEATALASVAALYIGRDDADTFYRYCIRNYTTDILINIEELMYISTAVQTLPKENGTVKYLMLGKEYSQELHGKRALRVTVPAKSISEFKVLEASDSVCMMSVTETLMPVNETDNPDISISREYSSVGSGDVTTEFDETDIIKVTIHVDYGKQAENGGYIINDYLPSGLRFIGNSLRGTHGDWAISNDGQRIQLYTYKSAREDDMSDEITYYARVVNPGTYTADNATLQSGKSTDILAATDKTEIIINIQSGF